VLTLQTGLAQGYSANPASGVLIAEMLGSFDLPNIPCVFEGSRTISDRTGPARTTPFLNSKPPMWRSGAQGED
jgi:hypothetical protein